MGTFWPFGNQSGLHSTRGRAWPGGRGMRMAAVCAGLVASLASCTNGYSGGVSSGVYGGGAYGGPFEYGPGFHFGNMPYWPYDDDDWRFNRGHRHKHDWDSLSDEEKARIKEHWKEHGPAERERTRERAHAQHRSGEPERFRPQDRPGARPWMVNPRERDRVMGPAPGNRQQWPGDGEFAPFLWRPHKSR